MNISHLSSNFRFGTWIQALRKSRRMSRKNLADRALSKGLSLSQQYVHFIETEKATNIGSDKIQALAVGLGIPVAIIEQALFQKKEPVFCLRGRVSAGSAGSSNADEYGEGVPYFEVDSDELTLYYVEIMGDSMAPKIEHGDLALIKPFSKCLPELPEQTGKDKIPDADPSVFSGIESGRIYLVQEAKRQHNTCKYLVEDPEMPGEFWLLAENKSLFPKTKLDKRFQILGEVIEVRKSLSLSCPTLTP